MPTPVTVTVSDTGTPDYSSFGAMVTGELAARGDLVSRDENLIVEFDAFIDTDTDTLDGFTADATRNITLKAASGAGHGGTPKAGYVLRRNYIGSVGHRLYQAHAVVEDLEFDTGGLDLSTHVDVVSDIVFRRCIFDAQPASDGNTNVITELSTFQNCLFLSGGRAVAANSLAAIFQNCSFINTSNPAVDNSFGLLGMSNATLENCVVINHKRESIYLGLGTLTTTALDDGAISGAIAVSESDFTDFPNGDYTPASGGTLDGSGTDLSTDFTDDITGATRSQWDVGAFAVATGGGTTVSAVTESLQVSTSQASISLDRAISASSHSFQLATNQSTISLDRTIGANVVAIELQANQASVSADKTISANVQSILVDTFAASTSAGSQISAAVQGIALTANQAQVFNDTALSATTQGIELGTSSANVVLGASIGAGSQGIDLTAFQAGITLDVTIQGSLHSISVETLAASVGLGSQIEAFTEALQLTTHGAVVEFGSAIQANTEQIYLSTFGAVVSGDTAAILVPGLEYTLPINRIHFTFTEEDG